jgi:hypothetical protein
MVLSGRAVSQHLWLAHGAARLRAHRVGDLRCSRGELPLAIGAAGSDARRTGHPCREVLDGAGARLQPSPWSAMGSIAYPFRPSPQTTRP